MFHPHTSGQASLVLVLEGQLSTVLASVPLSLLADEVLQLAAPLQLVILVGQFQLLLVG